MDLQVFAQIGTYSVAILLCLLGFILSCLSLSGTWLVLLAAGALSWMRWPDFPHYPTLILLTVTCIGVEVLEALAGSWGVQKRGGSKLAGFGAMVGGFIGMILGSFIPIPILGNLIGMLLGSFGLAFLAEHAKMKETAHATHVATGAVLARLSIIFLKIGVTAIMILWLTLGIIINASTN